MKHTKTFLLRIADTAAAGTRFQAAYRCKLPFFVLALLGTSPLDLSAAQHTHLRNALTVLGDLTGKSYLHLRTPRAIAIQMLHNWDIIGNSTYAYRAASDMLSMAQICGL